MASGVGLRGVTRAEQRHEPRVRDRGHLATMNVGEEILRPGDWLDLHTDDLIKARDWCGNVFGASTTG